MGGVHIFITPVQGSPPHQHASRCLTHREISIQNDTIRTVVNALDQILVVFRELVHTAPPQWNHNTPGGGPQGLFVRAQSRKKRVLHQLNFVDRCEDFMAPVAHALVRAALTLVSTLGAISLWLRLRHSVGQPILAAAGFPAGDWPRARILAEPEEPTERRPGKIARPAKRHGRNQTTEEKTSTRRRGGAEKGKEQKPKQGVRRKQHCACPWRSAEDAEKSSQVRRIQRGINDGMRSVSWHSNITGGSDRNP